MKHIPLTQGQVALVDDADFPAVSRFNWYADKIRHVWYAKRKVRIHGQETTLYLHQFLIPESEKVDHRDGNGLNNQRGNLRAATVIQNNRAFKRNRAGKSSQFRGVYMPSGRTKWQARICVNRRGIYLGVFNSEVLAAKAYDEAALLNFGEFAALNFPA